MTRPHFSEAEEYVQSAEAVLELVRRLPTGSWDGPGLGGWDLRSLVGHTSRALLTVLTYLQRPTDRVDLAAPEDYCLVTLHGGVSVDGAAVLERGRQAGVDLGEEPAAGFGDLLARVVVEVASADPQAVISTIGGGMKVQAYLPTRTFELVVHGLDIANAADIPIAFPTPVLDAACLLAARIAVRINQGPTVLRAMTGRAALPDGFSVVG